jgi:chromosome segregation ATPase
MTFFKLLQGIGDRLGILETTSNPESALVSRIQTRSVSLRELASEIRSIEVRDLADGPAELMIPFEKIFEAAGISSKPENWTIDRLKGVVENESCKQKPREEVQRRVLELLASEGVSTETLIKDAIARDQALDSFQSRADEKMHERRQSCKNRLLEIEQQIKDLEAERGTLEESLKAEEDKWREWKKKKRANERELASLTSYIVDHPVITMDEEKE